ncbi:septum formation initiator family protein [Demequina lignilytica]|uniref:Septum formation initiator family protein n=1 Tax=Demequina lignilytica TaxID=3051663 RepID=A0AB35MIT8_9MICO|nr:septum formation initiator family protein [Demequina sp. SYSU T0a273]MDN4483646.1 septum formation initiator family protein [Demequina sp. SYSU T0a273]
MRSASGPDEPRVPDAAARGWHAVEGPDARTVQVPMVPPAPGRGRKATPTGTSRPTSSAAERRARVQADQRSQAQARAQKAAQRPARGTAKAERPATSAARGPAKAPSAAAHQGRPAPSPARPASPRASSSPTPPPARHHEPSAPAGALANLRARFARTPAAAAPAAEPRVRAGARPPKRNGPATGGVRIPKGRASSRPGGPTTHARGPETRNRIEPARARGSWLTAASWRIAVLAGVLVLAAAVVLPSLRSYFRQQEELADLAAEAQAAQVEVEDLRAEAARWDDPAYVVAQARERLAFVFPGETPYRVIDPETVAGAAEGSPAAEEESTGTEDGVWYTRVWGSIAGEAAAEEEPAPATSDAD